MQRLKQPVGNTSQILAMANSNWQTLIDEGLTPAEARLRKYIPRPDSIEALMGMLALGFNPEKAKGKKGILQFHFTGDNLGGCYFVIDEKGCAGQVGCAEKADCTVDTPLSMSGPILFKARLMEGKCSWKGNVTSRVISL